MSERVQVPLGEDSATLPAVLWRPESGRGPGIVLLQEIFGLSPYIHRRAADLAAAGYVVVAPQIFWRLGVDAVPDGPGMLEAGVDLVTRLDWPAAVADGCATLSWLRARDEVVGGVGVVGFCFGGALGYQVAAQAGADALVSYYGSALPMLVDTVPVVTAPSQHHFGEADSYLGAATVAHIREVVLGPGASGATEFHTYPGADHAFDNADFVLHDAAASAVAWPRTVDFLHRLLPVG